MLWVFRFLTSWGCYAIGQRTHPSARLAMPGARPKGLRWTEWEQALRQDSLSPQGLAARVGFAFSQAVLEELDEREASAIAAHDPDLEPRRAVYVSLAKLLGVSVTTVAQTYLGHRLPTLDDLTLALRHPSMGPRLSRRLSTIEACARDEVLSRDQDSEHPRNGGDSAPHWIAASHALRNGGGRVLTEQEEISAMAALARDLVRHLARLQQDDATQLPADAHDDWSAARQVLSPVPAESQPSRSPSTAIRATGIDTDLAGAVRRLFAQDAELSNRDVLHRVNADLPAATEDGLPTRIDEHQINRVLHRLRQRGEIERVKQGIHRATPTLRKE